WRDFVPSDNGATKMTDVGPDCLRKKASILPSGEMAAPWSPAQPSGGEVSFRFSPLSIETRTMAVSSRTATNLLSGVHAGADHQEAFTPRRRSVTLRSTPPSGEIKISS